jgi:hypothetical protein
MTGELFYRFLELDCTDGHVAKLIIQSVESRSSNAISSYSWTFNNFDIDIDLNKGTAIITDAINDSESEIIPIDAFMTSLKSLQKS